MTELTILVFLGHHWTMADPELIPLAEAAARMQVSDKTIRRWIKAGRITGYRRGDSSRGPLFIDPADLDAQIQPVDVDIDGTRPEPRRPADTRPPKDAPKPPPDAPKRSQRKAVTA